MKLSDRIERLSESATIAMSRKSRELQAEGKDIINLSLGEPDFNTPDFIKKVAKDAIDQNYSKYTPVPGFLDLRESISAKFKRDNGLDYAADQIVVSTGAKQSIANVMLSIINPGDEVIIPAPFWVTYVEIVKMAEGNPVIVPTSIENDFKITAEQLKNAITDRSKLMIFSNPCNPTGTSYTADELEQLADVVSNTDDFYVVSDEIYEHIRFEGEHKSFAAFDNVYNQTITVNGVSKAWAMTGWRVGYIGAPKPIAAACTKIQGQFTSGTCAISQRAAKAAVEADVSEIQNMINAFESRRDLIIERLKEIPDIKINTPGGAFYIFPEISTLFGKSAGQRTINNASDFCMYLLEEAGVATVTGEAFGAPKCFRISYAASEKEIEEAAKRIKSAVEKLA